MEVIFEFLRTMPFWGWWVLAMALLVTEMSTGSTYFLWPAAAAVVVGAVDIWPLDGNWQAQLALFAVLTIALTVFGTPRVKPWINKAAKDHATLNERGAQKVGRRATVDEDFVNGSGRVRYGDTAWLAESEGGAPLAKGASVVITRAEGSKLFVKAAP